MSWHDPETSKMTGFACIACLQTRRTAQPRRKWRGWSQQGAGAGVCKTGNSGECERAPTHSTTSGAAPSVDVTVWNPRSTLSSISTTSSQRVVPRPRGGGMSWRRHGSSGGQRQAPAPSGTPVARRTTVVSGVVLKAPPDRTPGQFVLRAPCVECVEAVHAGHPADQ